MPADQPSDFEFLLELIRQTDDDPTKDVDARAVGAALGVDDDDSLEKAVRRLKNRGLIDWAPGPHRGGEGWTSTPLAVQPAGYRHDGTGLS